jgi:hypothetical protein
MLKKMRRVMKEINYFQKLKKCVGEDLFKEGLEIAKFYLQTLSYAKARKLLVAGLCRALLLGDIETAKKYAVALEVLKDFRKNQKN